MAKLVTKRRGGVSVLVMMLVLSTVTVAIVMLSLSGSTRTKQTRQESDQIVQCAFDGGVDTVVDMAQRGVLDMPQTVNLQIGDVAVSMQLSETAAGGIDLLGLVTLGPEINLIRISATLTYKGKVWRKLKVIGRGALTTIWRHALFCDGNITSSSSVRTDLPGFPGDGWIQGSLTLLGLNTYWAGDLATRGLVTPLTMPVAGDRITIDAPITFPNVSTTDYQAGALETIPSNGSLNGYTFPSIGANGYGVVYAAGDLSVGGSFSGTGVIFAAGKTTITSDITVSAGDHLVIISRQNITIQSGVDQIRAYLYCGGSLDIPAATNWLTVEGGVATKALSLSRSVTLGYDPFVRDEPAAAYRLRLPGVWP